MHVRSPQLKFKHCSNPIITTDIVFTDDEIIIINDVDDDEADDVIIISDDDEDGAVTSYDDITSDDVIVISDDDDDDEADIAPNNSGGADVDYLLIMGNYIFTYYAIYLRSAWQPPFHLQIFFYILCTSLLLNKLGDQL